ncbi:TBC1 domain family member 12 isoform X2 [Clupea harengus]|uniref:TBC1 domain family member 12 isoform X2 n=1 Tax=Clupea harengus TaxID=7950 RepID=A0A6P8GKK0_CLUHA|nr:TBC1 domain family member 12 isoform X2 [Clupea harengus]
MERAENGELVLALCVDLNENEEGSKKHHRPAPTNCNITEVKSRLLNDGSKKPYPADKVNSPMENTIMLDLIPGCLPDRINDSCVILKQYRDGILNGFPESSFETTMGSEAEGGGCGGTPSYQTAAVSSDRPQEGNGMLLPTRVSDTVKPEECAGETEDSNVDKLDKGHLNSEARPKSPAVSAALPCAGKHQQNCTCTLSTADMKLSNGDVDLGNSISFPMDMTCIEHSQETYASGGHLNNELDAPDRETKVSNGGLMIVNNSSLHSELSNLTLGTAGGLSDGGVLTYQLENIHSSPGSYECSSRESGHVSGETSPAAPLTEPACGVFESEFALAELCSKLSTTPSPEHNSGNNTETELSMREDSSEASVPSRPQSLRTTPSYAVSLSCDATPLGPDDGEGYIGADDCMDPNEAYRNTFEGSRRQSAPDQWPDGHAVEMEMNSEQRDSTKKHGIAEFFTRGLFYRKPKEPKPVGPSAPGWKLFGKIPLRENPPKDSRSLQQDGSPASVNSVSAPNLSITGENEAKAGQMAGPHPQNQPMRRKNLEFEPSSTTALILEDRPANLPAKSTEEAQRHRQEYDEMVAGAKRRELKEAQRKKRQMKERFKQEEIIANAMVIWNTEVLPNWESMRNTRRVRELWWQGLPPSVRGKVWSLAIGNELNITPELYEIFLSRAKEKWRSYSETSSENEVEDCGASLADRESSLDLIKLDISRTFPSLYIFQKGGPYHDLLHSVLGAYTCYRPDVGYVQGMSFIAAVLILNMEEADAFIAFANLLNKPCQMAFFRVDHDLMLKYFAAFEVFFEENLPRLFQHFQSNSLTPDFYLIDWIFTLYSKSLPLDVACRVWDVFCRDGEEALFRTGLGILRLYQDVLLQMDFIHSAQFLSRLPDNTPANTLFNCIANTHMLSSNRRWNQVCSALMKDGIREADKNHSPALRS